MSTNNQSISLSNKELIKITKEVLSSCGRNVKTSELYEVYSNLAGFSSWNVASAKHLVFAECFSISSEYQFRKRLVESLVKVKRGTPSFKEFNFKRCIDVVESFEKIPPIPIVEEELVQVSVDKYVGFTEKRFLTHLSIWESVPDFNLDRILGKYCSDLHEESKSINAVKELDLKIVLQETIKNLSPKQ